MGGDTNFQQPAQPSYAQGMLEALQAQTALLTGKQVGDADFRSVGKLEDLVRDYEAPLRKTTAQVDTDVMRQTLLGTGSGETYAEDGRIITGYESSPQEGQYKVVQDGELTYQGYNEQTFDPNGTAVFTTRLIDTATGEEVSSSVSEPFSVPWDNERFGEVTAGRTTPGSVTAKLGDANSTFSLLRGVGDGISDTQINDFRDQAKIEFAEDFKSYLSPDQVDVVASTPRIDALQIGNDGLVSEATPIYKQDESGQDIYAPEGTFQEGGLVRTGDGMVDLIGDRRAVQEQVSDYESYVRNNPDLLADFNANKGQNTRTIEEYGRDHYEQYGRDEGRELGLTLQNTADQAGFRDGQFMGLSALAEDIGRGGQQRAREADIADVERLGGRATDAYRAQGDLGGALETARAMGAGGSEGMSAIPANPLFGTSAQGTLAERTAQENLGISAITGGRTGDYDPRMEQGLQAGFQGPVQPGQATQQYAQPGGTDAFRSALMQQGMGALDQGLTARENRAIQEAARARSTNMGRTFDQTASIKEAEDVIREDNARRQQNRAFAQSALGQEVGIQQADMARGLQAQQLEMARQSAGVDRQLTAEEKDIERAMRRDAMQEQYRQQGLGAERASAAQMVGLEQATSADPFQAILQRQGQNNLGAGGQLFGSAQYGLQSGPQYLNPESGLGFISNTASNAASMFNAQQAADATRSAGLMGGLGSALGGAFGMFNFGGG